MSRVDSMRALYECNTPAHFWGAAASQPQPWEAAAKAAVAETLGGAAVASLERDGWSGLMEHLLGEAQFGPDRYRLSRAKRAYYRVRPVLPRPLTALLRRHYRATQETAFTLGWPSEDRFADLMYRVLDRALPDETAAAARRSLWPDGAPFAFVLTHDVERAAGQAFVRTVADLDERYGFRSSFNFVPEDYPPDHRLHDELRARGFEIGVHGLRHDGSLFSSRSAFERSAERINAYLCEWGAVGFRAPFTHRNPEWMQVLTIEYDASFFDTDPYETMPGGCMSIWPFQCGRFVELPYTLVQDHTLLAVLGHRTPQLWTDKVDFIAGWGGMALVNVHPDYLRKAEHLAVYEAFLEEMAARRAAGYWHALPREVARWWRARTGTGSAVASVSHGPS